MKSKIAVLGITFLMLLGCSSLYLDDSSLINPEKNNYNKILVIAKTKDKVLRMKFENQVVNDLAASGVQAISSMSVIKTESFSKVLTDSEIEDLKSKMLSSGYDGVIITNLINKEQYTEVHQGNVSRSYVPVSYGRFGRYYRYYPVDYWEEDEITTGTEYTLESCFYNITDSSGDNNLQWVGRFKIKDVSSIGKTVEKYSKELTGELLEKSIKNNNQK